jgi:uncharacterized protein YjaG (DUF416 family)
LGRGCLQDICSVDACFATTLLVHSSISHIAGHSLKQLINVDIAEFRTGKDADQKPTGANDAADREVRADEA